jgi:hypothetical protein
MRLVLENPKVVANSFARALGPAANRTCLGETRGRGRMDQHHEADRRGQVDLRLPAAPRRAAPARARLRAALDPMARGVT